jgi:nucleoside-diphosphate-sugar epimerase
VHSIREVVELARRWKPGAEIEMVAGGASQSPYPVAYDDAPARQRLGWQPSYSIESAVREHLEVVAGQF